MPGDEQLPTGGDQPVVPPPGPAPAAPPVEPAQPAAGGGGGGRRRHWDDFVSLLPNLGIFVLGALGIGLSVAIVLGLFLPSSIVRELGSPDLARGVITFIFSVGTIGIALLLAVGALVGQHSIEEFGKAKEVLTVLIGVFGTILGFYFGTAAGGGQKLDVAEIKFADKQLITHISGGTRPYRYSITSGEKDFTPINSRVSDDGWIIETLPQAPKPKSTLTVDVTDAKDQKASQKLDIPDTKPRPASPTQNSETTGTAPTTTPPTTTPGTIPPTR
jgi:hypothetical protein